MAMTLVSTVTVGAGGAYSIEFTNIPQTGKDLLVLVSARNPDSAIALHWIYFNGNTSGYNSRLLTGNGTSASSSTENFDIITGYRAGGASSTSNTFNNMSIYVLNYTSSVGKSVMAEGPFENNAVRADQNITTGFWTGTSAITSLSVNAAIVQHSTASLYIIS